VKTKKVVTTKYLAKFQSPQQWILCKGTTFFIYQCTPRKFIYMYI